MLESVYATGRATWSDRHPSFSRATCRARKCMCALPTGRFSPSMGRPCRACSVRAPRSRIRSSARAVSKLAQARRGNHGGREHQCGLSGSGGGPGAKPVVPSFRGDLRGERGRTTATLKSWTGKPEATACFPRAMSIEEDKCVPLSAGGHPQEPARRAIRRPCRRWLGLAGGPLARSDAASGGCRASRSKRRARGAGAPRG